MEKNFENIRPLIVSQEQDGMMIKLKFKASNQDTPIESVAVITPNQSETMKSAMKEAGKSAGVNMLKRMLRNLIGGTAGRMVSDAGSALANAAASSSESNEKMIQTNITEEKKQEAILQAFEHVPMYYSWENGRWTYKVPGQ